MCASSSKVRGLPLACVQRALRALWWAVGAGERLDGFMRELAQQQEMLAVFADKKKVNVDDKKDDYIARNVHRARVMSLTDWVAF